jgi:hypothetical protein
MKKLFFILLLFISLQSFAQDTSKVEQYCRLVATGKLFSTKVTIDVDFGEERRFWSDKRLRDETSGRLKKFNSITDALNYMGSQGWSLVNAFPQSVGNNSEIYHFYFKKHYDKAEVERANQ